MTGGHETKAGGGVGSAVSPPAGFGAVPRKILKFNCFQKVKSPISTPSAGDKNVLQAIVRLHALVSAKDNIATSSSVIYSIQQCSVRERPET